MQTCDMEEFAASGLRFLTSLKSIAFWWELEQDSKTQAIFKDGEGFSRESVSGAAGVGGGR